MRHSVVNKFNRGELDQTALDRDDVDRISNSCSLMENWTPLRLGPMKTRAGTQKLGVLTESVYAIPFVSSFANKAVIDVSTTAAKIVVDDEYLSRPTSQLVISNETFDSSVDDWVDPATGNPGVEWNPSGAAWLIGSTSYVAKMSQTLTGTISDTGIRIVVEQAPVTVTIGTTGVDSDDIFRGVLGVGTHELFLTADSMASLPTITVSNTALYGALVSEISIVDAGEISIPLPEEIDDLSSIRHDQSADALYVTTGNTRPFIIERRGDNSWSVVEYRSNDGPFGLINNTDITVRPGLLSGDTELFSNLPLFKEESVNQLFKIVSRGQRVNASLAAADIGTNSIKVVGKDRERIFNIIITGTFSATVTLQRSTDDNSWDDVKTYTSATNTDYDDKADNSIYYYRLYIKTGEYVSGTAVSDLDYISGSITGIARITSYNSPLSVQCQVLKPFGSLVATKDWYKGEWFGYEGQPTAVALYEGRLWFAGKSKIWGSVSDNYTSFDTSVEGSSAPIRRTIGFGPVDSIDWLAGVSRLIVGVATDEITVRSTSFGEVVTNTNCNLKRGTNQGVAPIAPIIIDESVYYVHRSLKKIMDFLYIDSENKNLSKDLMMLHPTICNDGIKKIVYTRNPETRIIALLTTGELRCYLVEKAEDVAGWYRITTDGTIDDICVLPGIEEDTIYLTVERNGVIYKEKMFMMSQSTTHYLDNAELLTNTSTTSISGLDRFNDETIGGWGIVTGQTEGSDLGDILISGGIATLSATYSTLLLGRRYNCDYRNGKLSGYIQGTVLGTEKRIVGVGFNLTDYMPGGLQFGPTFDDLDDMPVVESREEEGSENTEMIDNYDEVPIEFNGDSEVDPRICIRATRPCTIISLSYDVVQHGDTPSNQ